MTRTARQQLRGLGYTAAFASWTMPPGCSAGAPSAAAVPATVTASPGAGMRARSGRPAAVQRSVHDTTSLQYQRMSAHAWPPSATSRPSGSAMPHKQHWATSGGHRRSHCVAADGSADTRRGPAGSCPGPVSGPRTPYSYGEPQSNPGRSLTTESPARNELGGRCPGQKRRPGRGRRAPGPRRCCASAPFRVVLRPRQGAGAPVLRVTNPKRAWCWSDGEVADDVVVALLGAWPGGSGGTY